MPTVHTVVRIAVAALFMSLAAGCSSSGTPESESTSKPTAAEKKYYFCLKDQGVVLEQRDDEVLVVDKGNPKNKEDLMLSAQKACIDLLPDTSVGPASAETLAKNRKFTACMRKSGFPKFPEPHPETGEIEVPDSMPEGDHDALVAASEKCSPGSGDGDTVIGG